MEENKVAESQRYYGFRYNINRKGNEVGIKLEWVEKIFGKVFEVNAIQFVYAFLYLIVCSGIIMALVFTGIKKVPYVLPGILILMVGLFVLICMNVLTDVSSGSLLHSAKVMYDFKKRKKRVKKGYEAGYRDTNDGFVDENGFVWRKNGDVGRLLLVDGYTSPSAFPKDIEIQEKSTIAYQIARLRGVTEIKMSTVQPQNTNRQVRATLRTARQTKVDAIKDICEQQAYHLENDIEGHLLTTVQYIFVVASNKKTLDTYLEILENNANAGLYYSVLYCNKEKTEEVLTDIRQFR